MLFARAEKNAFMQNIFAHENFAPRKIRTTLRACASQAPEAISYSDFLVFIKAITISCASHVQKLVDQSIHSG
jgi:hypothetical protein